MSVKDHALFHREDNNLYSEAPISFATASLGGTLDVPTLDGRVKLKIPAETQSGKMFKLRGKGVKSVRGGPVGDLMCRVIVETPVKLSKKQKELLKEFEDSMADSGKKHSPKEQSWLDGGKNFIDDIKL